MQGWKRLGRGLQRLLGGATPSGIAALAVALTAVIAALDYVTGYELGFSLFYLAPIALAAWFGGARMGLVASVAAAVVWGVLDRLSGHVLPGPMHVWNAGIRFGFFALTSHMLSELRAAFAQLDALARTDALTSLPNRRAFTEVLAHELRRQQRTNRQLSLAYFDLDGFKGVNDRFGHAEGDRVLQAVASAARDAARQGDVVARLGGDEFAVLILEADAESAAGVVERIRAATRARMRESGWPTDLSIGVVTLSSGGLTPERAIAMADDLALEAKQAGRGCVAHAAFAPVQRRDTTAALTAASSDQKM